MKPHLGCLLSERETEVGRVDDEIILEGDEETAREGAEDEKVAADDSKDMLAARKRWRGGQEHEL